jgi:diguanylate cyclase (GGDEF)-like protein
MIDVDHFKGFNDKYGHLVGDAILREVARAIKENTRQIDLVARYGGEEFCVLMPETNRVKGYLAAERIRRSLEQRDIIAYDEKLRASVSIGLATFPLDARYVQPLIERADEALYRAKAEGRNRVC